MTTSIPALPTNHDHILIGILHWGLGHASRMVPVIDYMVTQGHRITVASDGDAMLLIQKYFGDKIEYLELPSYSIKYTYPSMWLNAFAQFPKVSYAINKEHKMIDSYVNKHGIKTIISDNRFGCWSKSCKNIYVTHQLNIQDKTKIGSYFLNKFHHYLFRKYQEIWVPDYNNRKLSGELSNPKNIRKTIHFIGPLSIHNKMQLEKVFDAVAVVSGPEPARSVFEEAIIKEYTGKSDTLFLISGKSGHHLSNLPKNITQVDILHGQSLSEAMQKGQKIISRSGYSTIMDLHILGLNAELYPTPGQSEQEYLAKLHSIN